MPVIAVDTDGNERLLRRSRNIDRVVAPGVPITRTGPFLERLAALGRDLMTGYERRVLLFPTEDTGLRLCADHYHALAESFVLLGDSSERGLNRFMDKGAFFDSLPREAPYVPWTKYFPDCASFEHGAGTFPYPVVVKPSRKDLDMSFQRTLGTKLIVLENAGDIDDSVRAIFPSEGVVVQRLIEHTEGTEVCWWGYRSRTGEITGMTARELRKYPVQGGTATFMRSERIAALDEYAREILQAIDFWGLCEMPFLPVRETQQYQVLELNPRCWLQLGLMHASGLNLPVRAYNEAVGAGLPAGSTTARERVTWMSPEYDLLRVFYARGGTLRNLARWFQDLLWADERAVWTLDEPGVFAARCLSYPAKLRKNRAMLRGGKR